MGTIFVSFCDIILLPAVLFICPVFTRENSSGKKLKSREGKSLTESMPEFLFSRSPPFFSEGDEVLFRGRMIYIKEMLFGNKQSGTRVGGS